MRTGSETSGTILNATTFELWGPGEEEKKIGTEKIFEEVTVENVPNMGEEIVNQVQELRESDTG